MNYRTEITVRGYHADFYGHVNNARYLEFFEEDRWRRLEEHIDLRQWAACGRGFAIVNINVNYRKAAVVGDRMLVGTALERVNTRSAVLRQEIVFANDHEISADALVTFVVTDASGKAMTMEGELLAELQFFEEK
ncbi:MAG: acyl-CoA thioesterase [Desulfopila sp.]